MEIVERDNVIVHGDVAETVDAILRGHMVPPEARWRSEVGRCRRRRWRVYVVLPPVRVECWIVEGRCIAQRVLAGFFDSLLLLLFWLSRLSTPGRGQDVIRAQLIAVLIAGCLVGAEERYRRTGRAGLLN